MSDEVPLTGVQKLRLIDQGWKPPESMTNEKRMHILIGHLLTIMEKGKWYYLSQAAGIPSIYTLITIPPLNSINRVSVREWKWSVIQSVMRQMYILDLVDRKDGCGNALVYRIKEKS